MVLFGSGKHMKHLDAHRFPSAPQHLRLRNNPPAAPAPASVTDPHAESELREDDALPLLPMGGQGAEKSID